VTAGKGKEAAVAAEAEAATPPEPVIVPSETIYMQIVEFLLDAKATAVKHSILSHRTRVQQYPYQTNTMVNRG